jgi:hypothetical protein
MAIGGRPPAVVGFANVTGTGAPLIVEAVIDGGHVIVSAGGPGVGGLGGGVGSVGDEHPAVSSTSATSHAPSSRSTAALMDTAIADILQCVVWALYQVTCLSISIQTIFRLKPEATNPQTTNPQKISCGFRLQAEVRRAGRH